MKFAFSGGVDGGRGWVGDVKTMLLDTGRIKALGWKPRLDSKGAVQQLVRVMRSERAR